MQLPSDQPDQIERLDEILVEREIDVDEGGTLGSDVACRKCGYNLKTQSLQGKCTECGCPVIDSILHPHEHSPWRRFVAKTVDILAFLTVWYFCTIACVLIISGIVLTIDAYVPFAAVMRERFSTTALTILLLLPTFFLARKISEALTRD